VHPLVTAVLLRPTWLNPFVHKCPSSSS
jgi:hypothetical protein